MYINSIALKRFRSLVDVGIVGLARFNLFQGPNNSGKTSILDSIMYALTGTCRGLDKTGSGAGRLNSDTVGGEKTPGSILLRTNDGEIARFVGQGPRSAAQRTVDKITGVSCDMVGVLVSPANFFALDSTAQRELILAAVGATIQVSEVAALLGDLVDMVRPETLTKLAGIDSWEKVLRTQRQMLKRQLKEYVYIPDQDVKPVLVNGKEFTGDIQDLLSKATTQLITIRRERDAIVAEHAAAQARQDNYVTRVKTLEDEQADCRRKLADMADDREAYLSEIAECQATLNAKVVREQQTTAALDNKKLSIAKMHTAIDILRETLTRVSGLQGECPTCTQRVDEGEKKRIIADITQRGQSFARDLQKQEAALNELRQIETGKTSDVLKADISALEKGLIYYDGLKEAAVQIERELGELTAPPPVVATDITALDERIALGEIFLTTVREHIAEVLRRDTMQFNRARFEQDLEKVERGVCLAGPEGSLRAKLLGDGITAFVKEVHDLAEEFNLPGVSLDPETCTFMGKGREADLLSRSEQIRLSLVLAGIFAKRSMLGILCLDDCESLDGENRAILPRILDKCGLEQAFLAIVSDAPVSQEAKDWAFYQVEMDAAGRSAVHAAAVVA